ncbi:MAG: hypothetical protein ACI89X_000292, partial [Planctomycetota bacterium]
MSKIITSSLLLVALTSCGGGSGGSTETVQGLQAPQQVSIVEAVGNSPASLILSNNALAVTGSDYETDPTRFWIEDNSMQALDTVNSILSSLQQTRYWEQTNEGAYIALISEDNRGGGGERGNNGTVYEEWIVNSTRANNSSAQLVSFWIEQDETMGDPTPSVIYGSLTVTAEPSDEQPLGAFTLYFKNLATAEASTSTDTNFEGYMRTITRNDSQSEVEFYMSHGDVDSTPALNETAMRDRVHVVGDPAAETGRAYTQSIFKMNNGSLFTEEGEYQIEFNSDYLARRDVTNANTLSVLDRNDFDTRVHRYGVYDNTTEDRIEQLSGFPVQDANGENGWAGYYGIWFPEGTSVSNGDTVLRRSFESNGTSTSYTVFIAPGRLEKRTREAITMNDLVNEVLEYFDSSAGQELQVMWTGQDFVKVGSRNSNGWTEIDPAVSIASSFTSGDWVSCWSQARGQVEWSWPASISNTEPAYVWQNTTITADSTEMTAGDLTLNGYFNMLRADITQNQANYQSAESPYLTDAVAVNSGNTTYTFDKDTLMLMIGANPVALDTGVTITSGPGLYGLSCGPLFETALTSFNEIGTASTTYQWNIGDNEWNQLRTLKDAQDNFVQFDAPLRLTYVHSESGSPYDGRTFFLEWDGQWLGGIPYEQETGSNNWSPLFNIPSGATATGGSTTYKIKQLEGEQVMVEVGSPSTVYSAQGFDIDGTPITVPTEAPYQDPAIGTKPTVENAPLYVGGVAQS